MSLEHGPQFNPDEDSLHTHMKTLQASHDLVMLDADATAYHFHADHTARLNPHQPLTAIHTDLVQDHYQLVSHIVSQEVDLDITAKRELIDGIHILEAGRRRIALNRTLGAKRFVVDHPFPGPGKQAVARQLGIVDTELFTESDELQIDRDNWTAVASGQFSATLHEDLQGFIYKLYQQRTDAQQANTEPRRALSSDTKFLDTAARLLAASAAGTAGVVALFGYNKRRRSH